MNALSFDTGSKTYTVNGSCEITFNPAADTFLVKFMDMMDRLNQITAMNNAEVEAVKRDNRKAIEFAQKRAKAITEEIDGLFGAGICEKLFQWGPNARAGGVPVWLNFCLAILDTIEEETKDLDSQANERLSKYIDKYKKYQRK